MKALTARQQTVLNEVTALADCNGEAFVSTFSRWNPRTLSSLQHKGLLLVCGETVQLTSSESYKASKAFVDNQNVQH